MKELTDAIQALLVYKGAFIKDSSSNTPDEDWVEVPVDLIRQLETAAKLVEIRVGPEPKGRGFQANTEKHGCARGNSVDEAIGDLIRNHAEAFGIELDLDEDGIRRQYQLRAEYEHSCRVLIGRGQGPL